MVRSDSWRVLVAGAIVAALLALAMVALSPAPPAQAALSRSGFEQCLLNRINDSRAAVGAPALRMATDLIPPVRAWSEWMRFNDFEHMSPSRRHDILPPSWTGWGENIAWNSNRHLPECSAIHTMLMNSPGHRANILEPGFRFVALGTYVDGSGWWVTELFFDATDYVVPCYGHCDDEIFFYRGDGLYRYYDIRSDGNIGSPILGGDGYTPDWSSITAIDLDGDGQDEMFFYRDDGLHRFYDIQSNGNIGSPIRGGDGYTEGWSSISAVDLDGDGQDEMFFYRDDGLYRFYDVTNDGSLGSPILAGNGYTEGWSSISAVDLDGDGQDEMFFYRDDGLYRYYDIGPDGNIGSPIESGNGYTRNWSSITAIDLDGDGQDEMFFYRDDGLYRYYDIGSDGNIGSPIRGGDQYTAGWSSITAVSLD